MAGTDIRRGWAVMVLVLAAVLSGPVVAADDKALDRYYNANALCRRGVYPLAAKEYEAFLAASPKHEKVPRAKWGLAVCRYSMNQMDKAAALLAGLAGNEQIADQEQLHNLWGSALMELGKSAEAVTAFAWTVKNAKRDNHKTDALTGLTQAHFSLKNWAQVIDVSNALNTIERIFAGELHARIGLATQKPAEFIILTFTQDTRELEERLATQGLG